MKYTFSLWALMLCLICLCDSLDRHRTNICYNAKVCIHNGHERCGVDGQGNLRRFYDSCDILEINCLKGTDYEKTSKSSCDDLPPIAIGADQEAMLNLGSNLVEEELETLNLKEEGEKLNQHKPKEEEAININQDEPIEEEIMNLYQEEPIVKSLRKKVKKFNPKRLEKINHGGLDKTRKSKSNLKINIYDFGLGKK